MAIKVNPDDCPPRRTFRWVSSATDRLLLLDNKPLKCRELKSWAVPYELVINTQRILNQTLRYRDKQIHSATSGPFC